MTKSNVSSTVLYGSLLAFILFVVYILHVNQEVFFTAHDRSEFLFGTTFFHKLMSKPFGLMQYVGAWLTQLFYHPALGSVVLVVLWALIFFAGVKAFRLQGYASALMILPVACLLTSVVDLGYWIYVFPLKGYYFSQSVGYLVMLLLLWTARCTPRKWHLIWYILALCAYPVLGWFALLFVLCLALAEKPTWRELLGVLLLLFTASTWRALLYSHLKPDDVVMAGFPHFENPLDSTPWLSIPFWVLGAFTVLLPLCGQLLSKRLGNRQMAKVLIPVACALSGILFTLSLMFHDKNYVNEMRMVRLASDDNWQEVLDIAAETPKPTTTMMFLKNIAMMNEGGLLERSFKSGNYTFPINNPDSLRISFLNIASPVVYYNYGMMNEAIRLSFENAIQTGFSPFYLKVLARCAKATGDEKLLKRYTHILHHRPFYGDWQPAAVARNVKELQQCFPDELTGVENSDSYIVNSVSFWYEYESKLASEQALFYAMISCDSHRFWPSLRNYLKMHIDEDFPVEAAYILFVDKYPEEKRMMIPVEETVYNRYKQFCETLARLVKPGKTVGTVAGEMRGEWGDTYWFYHYFGRQYSNQVERKDNEVQS